MIRRITASIALTAALVTVAPGVAQARPVNDEGGYSTCVAHPRMCEHHKATVGDKLKVFGRHALAPILPGLR